MKEKKCICDELTKNKNLCPKCDEAKIKANSDKFKNIFKQLKKQPKT